MEIKKERNSSIELMKILALFFVLLCHSLPLYKFEGTEELAGYINLSIPSMDIQRLILTIFSHLGQVGNALFIVSSAFFLLENRTVKKEKIALFICDTFLISVLYLLMFLIFRGGVPLRYVIDSLAPTTFLFYWFVTCYILLYAIHPWLNSAIEKMTSRGLLNACVWMFILYCGISFLFGGKYYYSQLIGFIVYYFFVAFWKKNMLQLSQNRIANVKLLLIGVLGFVGLIIAANLLGTRINSFSSLLARIETFINPFIVILSIASFNLANTKKSSNRLINKISSTSLLVFVISNNELVCSFIKPVLFEKIFNYGYYYLIVPICLCLALTTFVVSVLVSIVYMLTIQKCTRYIGNKVVSLLGIAGDKLHEIASTKEKTNDSRIFPLFNLSSLSTYRTELMGIASLGVIVCHACQHCDLPPTIYKLFSLGNECVDIFLFLGGMGMYYSLRKKLHNTREEGIGCWYKKRFSRIIIPYLVCAIPFYIWFCVHNKYGIKSFFYHLSGLSFWGEHEGMWYVDLLIPLYLLTPLIAIIIDRTSKKRIIPSIILMGLCFIVSIIPINQLSHQLVLFNVITNIQSVICRVPGYILGYYAGMYVSEQIRISWSILPACLVLFIILARVPYINRLYRGLLLGISMMLVFCIFLDMLKNKKISSVFKWLGERSLELYLANCILVPLLFTFTYKIGRLDLKKGNYFYYVLVFLIGFPLASLIHCVSGKVRALLKVS